MMEREAARGLLAWYEFKQESRILYVGKETDVTPEMLKERGLEVVSSFSKQMVMEEAAFDYVISIASLEYSEQPAGLLKSWKQLLKPDGTLLLGMNNRFGIRYFCGDRDPYTGRNFDGVENYRRAYMKKEDAFAGRMYSQAEIKDLLKEAGFGEHVFFSVISDLKHPSLIYREGYLPNEDLSNRVFPKYHYPHTIFLEEENLYSSLAHNGMFHLMANAYLIECSLSGVFSDVCQVTSSLERGHEDALLTVIREGSIVEKRAAYPEGQLRLRELIKNGQELKERGIAVVDATLEQGVYTMPYIEAEVGQVYLKRLLQTNKEEFLEKMDFFRDLILQSSEVIEPDKGDGEGAVLAKGYLDMVPLNSFYVDGNFVFYDQEFCREDYPVNVILTRMIATFYSGNPELERILPANELYQRYGLLEKKDHWLHMEWDFLSKLRRENELLAYYRKCRRDDGVVHSNRQRMNYSVDDYQRKFVDVFRNADSRKLILFGSGNFTKKFLAIYQKDYPVHAIIDNNQDKWGQEIDGVSICSPDILKEMAYGEYKVIICIKNYLSVMKQLEEMGIEDYGIYDAGKSYPRKPVSIVQKLNASVETVVPKKYHIGYVAGVFDLFHIGHLNLLRKAKEQCDYLIVGLVSDEGVWRQKKKYPVIPGNERVEVVRGCRYVNQAELLPLDYAGIPDAYRMFQFDCMFSGDDHGDSSVWNADREFLERQGADLVFFDYTKSTSSTKIRADLLGRK